jgi:hypothetical protein
MNSTKQQQQQQQQQDQQDNKRICKECKKSFYDIEIIKLSTYGQRDSNLVNLDGSKHLHLYNHDAYNWSSLTSQDNISSSNNK